MPTRKMTDRANRVMQLASLEAVRLKREYVGTEHVLLGIVREGVGPAAIILRMIVGDLESLRRQIEAASVGEDMITMGKLPHTPRVKKALEYAEEEARQNHCEYVGDHHLLLGLVRESEGVASVVLANLGATEDAIRSKCVATPLGKPTAPKASMPLWDYFAGQALCGVVSQIEVAPLVSQMQAAQINQIVEACCRLADQMMIARAAKEGAE